MNKYQEALYQVLYDNPKVELTTSDIHSSIGLLQELIDKYYKLEQENQVLTAISEKAIAQRDSQKEILDILKEQLCIEFTDDGEYESDIYYLNFKDVGNTLNNKDNPDKFYKIKEWKEND